MSDIDWVIDRAQMDDLLDRWAVMWEPEQRELYEREIERMLTHADKRLCAFAICRVVDTPKLRAAADRFVLSGGVDPVTLATVERETLAPKLWQKLASELDAAEVEALVHAIACGSAREVEPVLKFVDARLLWRAGRHGDPAVRGEVARRLAQRGRHHRARLAEALHLYDPPPPADDEYAGFDLEGADPREKHTVRGEIALAR